jgi:lipopolysaccharide/colanic/teichoic acid biosynthesis glycosyltransferase
MQGVTAAAGEKSGMRYPAAKRIFDLAVTLLLLPLALPLVAAIALISLAVHGRPVFFHQQRPGLRGASFDIWKFRTMSAARGAGGSLLPDAERLTRFGRLLRATSLDELPELWNVLRGEMSLVGPRPLLVQYLDRYSPEQARRHEMPPGITGWAQVNGRNAIEWAERLQLDVWYVDNWNLGLDMKILFLTIAEVFRGRGISRPGHATMPEFAGEQTPPRGDDLRRP